MRLHVAQLQLKLCMSVDLVMALNSVSCCVLGASRDPPEKQAPMCTVHSFPHNIDHCLTFARSEFEGHLEKAPAEANAFLLQPTNYLQVSYCICWCVLGLQTPVSVSVHLPFVITGRCICMCSTPVQLFSCYAKRVCTWS